MVIFGTDAPSAAPTVNTHHGPPAAAGQNPRTLLGQQAPKEAAALVTTDTPEGLAAADTALAEAPLHLILLGAKAKGSYGRWKTLSSAPIDRQTHPARC